MTGEVKKKKKEKFQKWSEIDKKKHVQLVFNFPNDLNQIY